MLYIDGISLSKIKEELKKILEGKRINRIFKNNEYTISIHFGKIELLLSCIPALPICYITKSKEQPILDIASSIISNLRKHLMNAMLTDVEQLGFDRILVFHFSRINELGEIKKYKIYFECIGKLSNVIFTDEENKILDTLKKFHISENFDRTLFLGETYTRPKFEKKLLPIDITESEFNRILENKIPLTNEIEGVGKFLNDIKSFKDFKNFEFSLNFGDILTILCALGFALNILLFSKIKKFNINVINITVIQMLTIGVLAFIFQIIFEKKVINFSMSFSLIYLILICTMLNFTIQNISQKYVPAHIMGLILSLEAIFGTVFAIIFLNETISQNFIIGTFLIAIAVILIQYFENKRGD